jgi:hypothetical protein
MALASVLVSVLPVTWNRVGQDANGKGYPCGEVGQRDPCTVPSSSTSPTERDSDEESGGAGSHGSSSDENEQ